MDLIKKYLEEETKDTGWRPAQSQRKDKFGNPVKTSNVARSLARQAMQSAIKDLKKGPEAGKRQVEEVEELDETPKVDRGLSDDDKVVARTARAKGYATGSAIDMGNTSGGNFRGKGSSPYKNLNVARSGERKGLVTKDAIRRTKERIKSRLNVEEVEQIDELNPPTVQKYITRAKFSTKPERRAMAQKAQAKLQQKKSPMKTEESELDETESKLYDKSFDKYADSFTKKGRTTPEKQAMYKKMAQNAYKMLPGKSARPNLPEEVELSEEMSHSELADHHFNLAKKYYKKSDAAENRGDSYAGDHFGEVGDAHSEAYHLHKQAAKSGNAEDSKEAHAASEKANDYNVEESVELDEALRHKIAGAVAAFLGNKIDPLHGLIMQKHGEEAYRQAATHIRQVASDVKDAVSSLHDKLHKQLRTGGLATEAVEDRILDKGHSPERLQKTIDKAREHEKSYFKKRADAFFKPTDYESRSKEDSRLKRVRKVMSAASAAKQYATDTAPKPFTGRIGRKQ